MDVSQSHMKHSTFQATYGLLLDVVESIGACVDDLALDLVCPTTVVSQAARCSSDVTLGHCEGFAVVERLNSSEEIDILVKEVRELDQQLATVAGGNLPPWALECLASGGNGNVNVLLRGLMDLADDLLVGRVDDVELLAIDTLDELVVDEQTSGLLILARGRRLELNGSHVWILSVLGYQKRKGRMRQHEQEAMRQQMGREQLWFM